MQAQKILDMGENSENAHMQEGQDDPMEEFIALLAQHDRSLMLYVISLCPNVHEAEDILQEVKIILWQKFDHFEKGTSFIAWARKIAFFKILSHRKNKKKQHASISDALLMEISDDSENRQELWYRRGQALNQCVAKLKEQQIEILQWRYKQQMSIEQMSEKLGRTQQAIYRQLSRLRQQLLECVKKNPISEEDS